jgi:hypothetical protein
MATATSTSDKLLNPACTPGIFQQSAEGGGMGALSPRTFRPLKSIFNDLPELLGNPPDARQLAESSGCAGKTVWGTNAPTKKKGLTSSANPLLFLAGSKGLEPSASGVTGRRYNQLNYDPIMWWAEQGSNL